MKRVAVAAVWLVFALVFAGVLTIVGPLLWMVIS